MLRRRRLRRSRHGSWEDMDSWSGSGLCLVLSLPQDFMMQNSQIMTNVITFHERYWL